GGRAVFFLGTVLLFSGPLRAGDPASVLPALVQKAREERLSEDRTWLALLHARCSSSGHTCRSTIDDPGFFLSSRGRTDPAAEMEATLAAFLAPDPAGPDEEHPQCRYP